MMVRREEGGLRDAVVAWIAGHEDDTQLIRLSGISGSSLLLEYSTSKRLHMSVPSSREEAFLVTAADPDPDPPFDAALMILNEKLERLGPEPDSLFLALDYLLSALKSFESSTSCQVSGPIHAPGSVSSANDNDVDSDGDDGDDYVDEHLESDEVDFGYDMASIEDARRPSSVFMELRHKGFLYAMATEAQHECDAARRQFDGQFDKSLDNGTENVLAWCIVKPDPAALTVEIKMQMGGIMCDDVAAASLGLSLDSPMHILLQIDKDLWGRAQPTSSWKVGACHVKAGLNQNKESLGESKKDGHEDWDNDQRHKFGEEVFVPELIYCFFRYLERRDHGIAKSSDVLKELQQFSAMRNTLLGLIHFLATRFRALPNWCIACWDTLPYQVGRLRTCDKDLCLYRFEELGLGTSILQEMHNCPELIDFEISLAVAAAASERDVFEPFPAFLLEKEEIRDRSGWFSKKLAKPAGTRSRKQYDTGRTSCQEKSNKSFRVLESILKAYPPLAEMQCFEDEKHLKKGLAKLWRKSLDMNRRELDHEKWGKKPSLPYDVLRFLISSNRSTICLLKDSEVLSEITGAVYQFAVLHDNPEKEAHFERRRAEKGGSFFAFHGSAAGNWFSILRNGLRSLSNTRYMSTGAVWGAGIYTATDIATSCGYATPAAGWKHGCSTNGGRSFCVLAICEIVNGSLVSKTQPSDHVKVVRPDCEGDISIRYILVLPGEYRAIHSLARIEQTHLKACQGEGTDLQRHHSYLRELHHTKQERKWQEMRKARWLSLLAMCNLEEEKEEIERGLQTLIPPAAPADSKASHLSHGSMPGCMQAIQKELKNILSQINAAKRRKLGRDANIPILTHINIDLPDESNLQKWHVDLSQDLFKDSMLYQDLAHRALNNGQQSTSVKLECVFPDTFPMAPPFIRVMSPRFRFHTGHITVGGSICMELLTESGWSPAFCFESVLVQIVSAMIEGGARLDSSLDSTTPESEYSVDEARMAFDRVARAHGWIKN